MLLLLRFTHRAFCSPPPPLCRMDSGACADTRKRLGMLLFILKVHIFSYCCRRCFITIIFVAAAAAAGCCCCLFSMLLNVFATAAAVLFGCCYRCSRSALATSRRLTERSCFIQPAQRHTSQVTQHTSHVTSHAPFVAREPSLILDGCVGALRQQIRARTQREKKAMLEHEARRMGQPHAPC